MYKRGQLQIVRGDELFGIDDSADNYRRKRRGTVYLDHSCDQWIIGGKRQIRELIADLQAALAGTQKSSLR